VALAGSVISEYLFENLNSAKSHFIAAGGDISIVTQAGSATGTFYASSLVFTS
jgi:hypothetical protein